MQQDQYCLFYRVKITVTHTWYVVGIFRNEDHLAFERTDENDNSVLDFFVPSACEHEFLNIIAWLQNKGYVLEYGKRANPLITQSSVV